MSLDIKLNLVSSAKRLMDISLSITSTKSLIYIRKSKGPITDPCGTPDIIVTVSDI